MGGLRSWPNEHVAFSDRVLALGLFVLALIEVRWDNFTSPFLPLGALAITTIPVAFRRQRPLLAASIVYLGTPVLEILGGVPGGIIISTMLVFHSVGMAGDLKTANIRRLWLLVPFGITVLVGVGLGNSSVTTLVFFLVINPGVWVFSNTLRGWAKDQEELELQNALLRQTEADRIQSAIAQERTTIARELHDIIAHNMSVIVVQAGAAQRVIHSSPDTANESLKAIEHAARQALDEMRLSLGVMRGKADLLEPQPDLAGIEALVETVRRAGLDVSLNVDGQERPIPPAMELSGYRIIQEALTNTLKHGGLGAKASVGLTYKSDVLAIDIRDTGIGHPPEVTMGHGLIGIQERVALFGGKVTYGNQEGHGFFVAAELPLMVSS